MRKRFDSKFMYIIASIILPVIFFFTSSLQYEPKITLSIMIFCLILWISEIAPLSVVGLLGVVLTVIFGVNDIKNAFSGFSNPVILLMIGSFILANAINKYGLDKRISLYLLSVDIFSKSPFTMFVGLTLITFLLSMWLSNTATTAMMLPIAIGILSLIKEESHGYRTFASMFLLAIAYSASLGGVGTLIGSPTNLVGVGFLKEAGKDITFLEWSIFSLPIALSAFFALILYVKYKIRNFSSNISTQMLKSIINSEKAKLPKITFSEKVVGLIFGLTVILWILPSLLSILGYRELSKIFLNIMPESYVAIFTASLLFLIPQNSQTFKPILSGEDLKSIDWDTVLLFASGLSLGKVIENSGLGKIIGDIFSRYFQDVNILIFFIALIFFIIVATEIISNTATAITFIPIVIHSLQAVNVDITYPVMATIIAASFAFVLPISTPPNAIVYGTKLIPIKTMIKTGIILDIIGGVIIFIFLNLFRGG
ncbi:MAG: SLC13 family permease [Hydrogenothermaceae bacterium]|nr:SLC13 family permease [Hydrogenothermaceae bacterium]